MNKSLLKYLAALLLFGTNGIVSSRIALSSYEIVFWRCLLGSICLLAVFLLSGHRFTFMKHKKDFLFAALSGVGLGVSWIFLYEAYVQIGVSVSSLLYYSGPVIVMVLSPVIFHEKITAQKLVCFSVVLFGIVMVNGSGFGGNVFGIFCGIMAAVMYSVMVICSKLSAEIKGIENSLIQLVSAFLISAVYYFIRSGVHFGVKSSDIIGIVILGVINTGIACYLYFSSMGELPVQTVAICGYLEPLSAVIFSVAFLGETMGVVQTVGAIFIIGGAFFGEFNFKNKFHFRKKLHAK